MRLIDAMNLLAKYGDVPFGQVLQTVQAEASAKFVPQPGRETALQTDIHHQYTVGDTLMRFVFEPNKIRNLSDMQRILDTVEQVLQEVLKERHMWKLEAQGTQEKLADAVAARAAHRAEFLAVFEGLGMPKSTMDAWHETHGADFDAGVINQYTATHELMTAAISERNAAQKEILRFQNHVLQLTGDGAALSEAHEALKIEAEGYLKRLQEMEAADEKVLCSGSKYHPGISPAVDAAIRHVDNIWPETPFDNHRVQPGVLVEAFAAGALWQKEQMARGQAAAPDAAKYIKDTTAIVHSEADCYLIEDAMQNGFHPLTAAAAVTLIDSDDAYGVRSGDLIAFIKRVREGAKGIFPKAEKALLLPTFGEVYRYNRVDNLEILHPDGSAWYTDGKNYQILERTTTHFAIQHDKYTDRSVWGLTEQDLTLFHKHFTLVSYAKPL